MQRSAVWLQRQLRAAVPGFAVAERVAGRRVVWLSARKEPQNMPYCTQWLYLHIPEMCDSHPLGKSHQIPRPSLSVLMKLSWPFQTEYKSVLIFCSIIYQTISRMLKLWNLFNLGIVLLGQKRIWPSYGFWQPILFQIFNLKENYDHPKKYNWNRMVSLWP